MYSSKFSDFDISSTTYKVVNKQEIKAFIMIPKSTLPGKHPVITKFHGGGFVTGASLFADWFPQWALDLCTQNSGLFVTPDYRLLPESNAHDILDDLSDFWKWVKSGKFQDEVEKLKHGVQADLLKLITYGESAGASLALFSGFQEPDLVKAVIATYPMVHHTIKRTKPIGFMRGVVVPPNVLDDYLQAVVPGKIVSSAFPPERVQVWMSMVQAGRFEEFFGTNERVSLIETFAKIEKAEDAPFMLVLHATDDTAVPIYGSYELDELAKEKFGPGKVELIVQPGEHGFDVDVPLETPWLRDGLDKVVKLWLH